MIRLTANGGLPPLRQKTSDTHGESPVLSERNLAPAAFNLNQSGAVCLPLVTEGQKLIWVISDQMDLQLNDTAELDKAFDRFPYLTRKQTAELARCCSLHPDQVKMWFMVQRLRYGISWEYEDICKTKWKFKLGQGKVEPQGRRRKNAKEDTGEKKTQESTGGESVGEAREVEEDERKKGKRMTATDKMVKKRRKRQEEGVADGAGSTDRKNNGVERELQASTQTEMMLFTGKKPAQQSFMVLDAVGAPPLTDAQTTALEKTHVFPSSTPNVNVTPANSGFVAKPEAEAQAASYGGANANDQSVLMTNNPAGPKKEQGSQGALPALIPFQTKTPTQLALLKTAFASSQYPDSEEYKFLEVLTGMARCSLVQWFADMRYYIKKGKPRWLTQEQYSQALNNIRYQQLLKELAGKGLAGNGRGQKIGEMPQRRVEEHSGEMAP